MKKKIDTYFERKSAEEVEESLKGYGLKEEKTYTLDEFKSEVEKFKTYLMEVSFKHKKNINVKFEWESSFFDWETGNYAPCIINNNLLTEIYIK